MATRKSELSEVETLSPLVAATDPRYELRSSLEATRYAMESRRNVLQMQVKQLNRELQACCDTIDSCISVEDELTLKLTMSQDLALVETA